MRLVHYTNAKLIVGRRITAGDAPLIVRILADGMPLLTAEMNKYGRETLKVTLAKKQVRYKRYGFSCLYVKL